MSYHVTNQEGVGQELVHPHIIKGMYECGMLLFMLHSN